MESAARNDIRIMWLTDELTPSHQTTRYFINNHLSVSIKDIFTEINKYIISEEKIDTDVVYVDGTKIESFSNKYKFVWRGSIEKYSINLHKKITKIIKNLNKDYKTSRSEERRVGKE